MFFSRGKKKKDKTKKTSPDNFQGMFRFASLVIIILIIYKVYANDGGNSNIAEDLSVTSHQPELSKVQVQKNIQEAFERMARSPQFKKIKEFVDYIEENKSNKEAKILTSNDGLMIYIPKVVLDDFDRRKIDISNDDLKILINFERDFESKNLKNKKKLL